MPMFRFAPFLVAAGLLVLAGCGGGPKLAEVEGTIKLKGKALDRIQVEFWPVGNGPKSFGETDAQGRFTLTTIDGKRKGAVVGPHRVVLRDSAMYGDQFLGRKGEDLDLSKGKKPRLGNVYGDPQQSPLKTVEVKEGKNDIELEVAP